MRIESLSKESDVANDTTAAGSNAAGTQPQSGSEQNAEQKQQAGHKSGSEQQQFVEQKWDQIRSALKAKWSQLSDQDLQMIDGDSRKLVALVHQKTHLPLHEIEEEIDAIAAESEGLLSRIARTASEFAQTASQYAQTAGSQVAAPVQKVYSQAREMVESRPLPSVATVFGAGMLLGILAYALTVDER